MYTGLLVILLIISTWMNSFTRLWILGVFIVQFVCLLSNLGTSPFRFVGAVDLQVVLRLP